MADPQGKNRLQEFKYKGKDQDVSRIQVQKIEFPENFQENDREIESIVKAKNKKKSKNIDVHMKIYTNICNSDRNENAI